MPLFLVPTPIGNLADITYRAVDILKTVDFILAEDTRTSSKLLQHYQISTPLKAYHAHNEHQMTEWVIVELKREKKIALITDAGTPGISDPGFHLAKSCYEAGLDFESLPGATALIPALVMSTFSNHHFTFFGFLPQKKGRATSMKEMVNHDYTAVFYESPHKLLKTLSELALQCNEERLISVSRELTKKFEETKRGRIVEVLQQFKDGIIKGEFVIVLEGLQAFRKRIHKFEKS